MEWTQTFMFSSLGQYILVKELFQIGDHDTGVKRVVHSTTIDSQLKQTVDKVPTDFLSCDNR